MIQLCDLSFRGCIGCASCKRPGHPSYNKCILKDDLTPILQELRETDVVILGTPLMFAKINGDMQNFLERWFQPENTNEPYNASMWPRVTRTALYLTTYQSQAEMLQMGYQFPATGLMKRFVGDLHVKLITDTMQFPEDSNNYYAFQYDAAQRKRTLSYPFPRTITGSTAVSQAIDRAAGRNRQSLSGTAYQMV